MQEITPLIFLSIFSIFDIFTRRIPNLFVLLVGILGVFISVLPGSEVSFINSFLGFMIGFLFFLPSYVFGFMGGGDLKVFAVTGLYLGPVEMVNAFIYTLLFGGILAIILYIYINFKDIKNGKFKIFRSKKINDKSLNSKDSTATTLPYILAIFFGVLTVTTIK